MRRVTLILLALGALVVLGVFSSIVSHGFGELTDVEEERERLKLRALSLIHI